MHLDALCCILPFKTKLDSKHCAAQIKIHVIVGMSPNIPCSGDEPVQLRNEPGCHVQGDWTATDS